jgi:hypothetical protein
MGFVKPKTKNKILRKESMVRLSFLKKLIAVLGILIGLSSVSFAQGQAYLPSYDDDYDALDTIEEEETDTLEQRYEEYIARIRKGDRNVLRLIVYEEYEAVHKRIKDRTKSTNLSYYEYIGRRSSLNAFFGGIENQDPKVRLKCLGYLADYVDEVRDDYALILKSVNDRLKSGDETRREVEFALKVLRAKIKRREYLNRVREGDQKLLTKISPDDFLILVSNQRRLQIEWCYETDITPNDIIIRSINLDYFDYETNRRWYLGDRSGDTGSAEWKIFYERLNKDFLTRTIDYKVKRIGDPFDVGDAYSDIDNIPTILKVLLSGFENPSLFVREECAFVFLDIINDRRYDNERETTLDQLASISYFQNLAKKAYDEVKYSYYEWADYLIGNTKREHDSYTPAWVLWEPKPSVDRDFRDRNSYPVLIKEILNKLKLEWYHSCEVEVTTVTSDLHVRRLFDEEDPNEWRIDELSGERSLIE